MELRDLPNYDIADAKIRAHHEVVFPLAQFAKKDLDYDMRIKIQHST